MNTLRRLLRSLHALWLRLRLAAYRRGTAIRLGPWSVVGTDGPNLYMQYKDECLHGIYDFTTTSTRPRIIDGGANIGMSILRFRQRHPGCHITAFEPDAGIAALCERNLQANGITDVDLRVAALGIASGTAMFSADQGSGGRVTQEGDRVVTVETLSSHLDQMADFVKLNIEGGECEVLEEVERAGRLGNISQMVVEYHGWPDRPPRLGQLLSLLERNGFRYLVHDLDVESGGTSKPPFRIPTDAPWFCLVYAMR